MVFDRYDLNTAIHGIRRAMNSLATNFLPCQMEAERESLGPKLQEMLDRAKYCFKPSFIDITDSCGTGRRIAEKSVDVAMETVVGPGERFENALQAQMTFELVERRLLAAQVIFERAEEEVRVALQISPDDW